MTLEIENKTALKVQNLQKSFGGNRVVDSISFEVSEGLITGIIGPNGAGKTTCFNLITGTIKSDEGKIYFANQDITSNSSVKIFKAGIHRTFQIPQPANELSVLENMMIAFENQTGEKILGSFLIPKVKKQEHRNLESAMVLLRKVNLHKLALEKAGNLSGGQRKLLELARSLVDRPKMLLLDEPTAGINPVLSIEIGKFLKQINKTHYITMIVISHDMQSVRQICDEVIVMANGKVIKIGTFEDVVHDKQVHEAYLGN